VRADAVVQRALERAGPPARVDAEVGLAVLLDPQRRPRVQREPDEELDAPARALVRLGATYRGGDGAAEGDLCLQIPKKFLPEE
jgi:hypothetical protein